MNNISSEKMENLVKIIRSAERIIVAFSGGIDSAFLLQVCVQTLGPGFITAVTAASETYTAGERSSARKFAADLGVEHVILETEELKNRRFSENSPMRCYYCKGEFYSKVREYAREKNITAVFDGSNLDDEKDYRPGRQAVKEHGVCSPLIDAGFTKNDIRFFARQAGIAFWNKPANPCLASRIPYGTAVTAQRLEAVEKAEIFFHDHNFQTVRVRNHDQLARIEITPDDFQRFFQDNFHSQASAYLKSLGFTWVSLDLEGYRTGSLNEIL
ncbi:MAG: TIGR00268 family protein [Spirochaetes bacterium GWF1_41_5]|nr:MAG: TIGR00268 family protein [Spirochaetes bacterium GWF1_41_5]